MLRPILLSEMALSIDNSIVVMLVCVVVGIPIVLGLGFYLIARHVNRQFDRRPAVEQPDLDKGEALVE
jgi:hypothetical protein